MKRRKVIIDCDPGVDDAVMLALTSAHQDQAGDIRYNNCMRKSGYR